MWLFLISLLFVVQACAVDSAEATERAPTRLPAPARPDGCVDVAPGADLQRAIGTAPEGSALCLQPGSYDGPLRIDRRISLWGGSEAIIRSRGTGTTIDVTADGARVLGFTIDGSGGRFDTLDAALRLEADDAIAEGLTIRNAVFGILVEKSRRVTIRNNHVLGPRGKTLGLRGDSIRIWETYDSLLEGNRLDDGRDLVIWYSRDNVIRGNVARGGRYGSHLMYSHGNVLERNRYIGNVVGVFLMYSRNVVVRENLFADSSGAAGVGLGAKESGNLEVVRNLFVHDTVGIYLDTSPLQLDDRNLFSRNVFRLSETGVVFHSSPHRNAFLDNDFSDNFETVRVEGGGDALDVEWKRNYFDDYAGYDFDGDGTGDVPFELRSLSSDLTSQYPSLAYFRGAPVLRLVNLAAHVMPLLAPTPILSDVAPRMRPRPLPFELEPEDPRAN